jgi:hypothetical protein
MQDLRSGVTARSSDGEHDRKKVGDRQPLGNWRALGYCASPADMTLGPRGATSQASAEAAG